MSSPPISSLRFSSHLFAPRSYFNYCRQALAAKWGRLPSPPCVHDHCVRLGSPKPPSRAAARTGPKREACVATTARRALQATPRVPCMAQARTRQNLSTTLIRTRMQTEHRVRNAWWVRCCRSSSPHRGATPQTIRGAPGKYFHVGGMARPSRRPIGAILGARWAPTTVFAEHTLYG